MSNQPPLRPRLFRFGSIVRTTPAAAPETQQRPPAPRGPIPSFRPPAQPPQPQPQPQPQPREPSPQLPKPASPPKPPAAVISPGAAAVSPQKTAAEGQEPAKLATPSLPRPTGSPVKPPMEMVTSPPKPKPSPYSSPEKQAGFHSPRFMSPKPHLEAQKHEPLSPWGPPKTKALSPSLSPLSLPQAQVISEGEHETTQKSVLTVEKTKPTSVSNNHQKDTKLKPKKVLSDSEESGIRVITIAGDNKGAVMEITRSPYSTSAFSKTAKSKTLMDEIEKETGGGSSSSSSSSGEESGDKKKMGWKKTNGTLDGVPMKAFVNSNVQGINNSLMYNSSSTHHDPGLHLKLSRKPSGTGYAFKDYGNGYRS